MGLSHVRLEVYVFPLRIKLVEREKYSRYVWTSHEYFHFADVKMNIFFAVVLLTIFSTEKKNNVLTFNEPETKIHIFVFIDSFNATKSLALTVARTQLWQGH